MRNTTTRIRTETREQKAQRLIDTGCVKLLHTSRAFPSARIQGDHGSYFTILFPDGTFDCECRWGEYNHHTSDLCSHALALHRLTAGRER